MVGFNPVDSRTLHQSARQSTALHTGTRTKRPHSGLFDTGKLVKCQSVVGTLSPCQAYIPHNHWGDINMKGVLLWLVGVPIPVIILLYILF